MGDFVENVELIMAMLEDYFGLCDLAATPQDERDKAMDFLDLIRNEYLFSRYVLKRLEEEEKRENKE